MITNHYMLTTPDWEDCDDDMCGGGGGEGVNYDFSSSDDEQDRGGGDDAEQQQQQQEEEEGGDEVSRLISDNGGVDSVFPPLDGTAFYETICRINHSCDPNVAVKYVSPSTGNSRTAGGGISSGGSDVKVKGLHATLVALRDISAGEELLQAYIDCDMTTDSRQLSLRDYGFVCTCRRCSTEV